MPFPAWTYYPQNLRPPLWVQEFLAIIVQAEAEVSTASPRTGHTSDVVLQHLAPGLKAKGYLVEEGRAAAGRIRRPVLFGDEGRPSVTYDIDAFHEGYGIVVEVEAGRGARGNAVYRDIVRTSLILDARFLALVLPVAYRHQSGGRDVVVAAFREARDQFNAIYASRRLQLPFDGVLLVGY